MQVRLGDKEQNVLDVLSKARGYVFVTVVGPFTIIEQNGLFIPNFNGFALGAYVSPQFAADDVADGYANPHPSGIDTATLGIPHDLAEWRYFEGSEKKQ